MKKLLLIATLALTACTTQGPAIPHLTTAGLTVTVHNPTKTALTGDTSRGEGPAVSVDGAHIAPAPGAACTKGEREGGVRWACSVPPVPAGGTQALTFVPDGEGAAIADAIGLGYLGTPFIVPLPLLR